MYPKRTNIPDLLRRWIEGSARYRDKRALDQVAGEDPFLQEALTGFRNHPEADHADRIRSARQRLVQRQRRTLVLPLWGRIAATLALILTAGGVIYFFSNPSSGSREIALEERAPLSEVQEAPAGREPEPDRIADRAVEKKSPPSGARSLPQPEKTAPDREPSIAKRSLPAPPPEAPSAGVAEDLAVTDETVVVGIVVDTSGLPIAGAMVALPERQTTAVSDQEGRFELPADLRTPAQLTVTKSGYSDTMLAIVPRTETIRITMLAAPEAAAAEYAAPQATPQGGFTAFERYISREMAAQTPRLKARRSDARPFARMAFTIDSTGRPQRAQVLEASHPERNDRLLQLLQNGPSWILTPGSDTLRMTYTIYY